jgi:hypothetical protein
MQKIVSITFLVGLTIYIGLTTAIKTPIMGDEALTLFLGTLPSLSDLYQSLRLGADSHGPAYHTLNWIYQRSLFEEGASNNFFPIENMEIYTRLPSIFSFCIAISIVFLTLNKQLPTVIAFFLSLTLLYSAEGLRHIAEIRSYSFLMLSIALSFWSLLCYQKEKRVRFLIVLSLCILFGSLSHPLAAIYIGALGGTYLTIEYVSAKRLDVKLLLALTIPILPYLGWLTWGNTQVASTLSESVRWERPPTLREFFEFSAPSIFIILSIILIFKTKKENRIFRVSNYPLWFGVTFVVVAAGLWAISQFTNPLFLERYIWPLQLGWVMIALGILVNYTYSKRELSIAFIGCMILTGFILTQKNPTRVSTGGFWSDNPWAESGFGDSKYFSEDIPILCESSTTYLPRKMYLGDRKNYILLLVPPKDDLKTPSPRGIDYLMSKALKQTDKRQNILDPEEILENHKRFYLLNETFLDSDTYAFPNSSYKRTLLNPNREDKNQTLRIELIEKITN